MQRQGERMLLVFNVVYCDKVAAHVARDIHKRKGWASQWLKRYREEGINGLDDRLKGGRHPKVSRQAEYRIKTILKESIHGWTTKQVEEMIIQESGIRYHHNYIYSILRRWGFRQKVPKKGSCKHRICRRKERIQKKARQILVDIRYQKKKKGFTIVSTDESFIFYDSLVRRVWIEDGKRPVVKITGSHKHSCLFGAIDMEGKQAFYTIR